MTSIDFSLAGARRASILASSITDQEISYIIYNFHVPSNVSSTAKTFCKLWMWFSLFDVQYWNRKGLRLHKGLWHNEGNIHVVLLSDGRMTIIRNTGIERNRSFLRSKEKPPHWRRSALSSDCSCQEEKLARRCRRTEYDNTILYRRRGRDEKARLKRFDEEFVRNA